MERLKALVDGEGLKYFLDPNRDGLMLAARGLNGSYHFLVLLELEGRFIQFRTINYHSCPEGHEHLEPTLKVLGGLDYGLRFVKFGWDPTDGEVTVFGDTWIEDGDITPKQFERMIHAYLTVMDLNYARIDETIRTGKDPGEQKPGGPGGGLSGLPPALQAMVDKMLEAAGSGEDGEDDEGEIDSI